MPEESRRALKPLDARAPLVIDTRELGRRPGAMRKLTRTVPAPAGLGVDVAGVPEGSDVDLGIRLESVVEGVLVSGTAHSWLTGECVRCLDPFGREFEVGFQELYVYAGSGADPDDETPALEGGLIDLEPVLRDAVVLALPLQPVCRADCPGLCAACGARLADDPDHRHDVADLRWAALADWTYEEKES
jgi:uncharacterized protein